MDSPLVKAVDSFVRSTISAPRYAHSRQVAELARELCARFAAGQARPGSAEATRFMERGFIAGLAHDAARELPDAGMLLAAARDGLPILSAEKDAPVLLHGRAAAVLLAETTGYGEPEVLQAIRDHVTGRPGMGRLSKILFAADFLEPTRDFLDGDFRRETLARDLDAVVLAVLKRKIQYVRAGFGTVSISSLNLCEELGHHA